MNHTGRINQHVELAPAFEQFFDHLVGPRSVGHVGLNGPCFAAELALFGDELLGGFAILVIEERHPSAIGRELFDACPADAAAAAGDERGLAG